MKLCNEYNLLVIVGSWNKSIFTAEWITKYLLPGGGFSLEFSLNLGGTHRISTDKLRIEFQNDRINFIPLINTNEVYELISNLASKISDYLPHTPVVGFGVNFLFETEKIQDVVSLVKLNDEEKFQELNISILNTSHRHSFKYQNMLINLSIIVNEKLNFDFNFHFDLNTLTQFKDQIYEHSIDSMYQCAKEIMSQVYGLNMP